MSFRDWQDEAPDVRVLWDKTPKAKRPHLCDCCSEPIEPGTVYRSLGVVTDGVFEATKTHRDAYQYPSGCPRFAVRDGQELAEQFAADRKLFSGA